jgi:hypothetical protein
MRLDEALKLRKISYTGTRDDYTISDSDPNILVLDPDYKHDEHGRSILAFNFNYLDSLSRSEKKKFKWRVNKVDGKLLDDNNLKTWVKDKLNIGDYEDLSKEEKIKRYKKLIREFPELKKIIRRYKYSGIGRKE